MFAQMEQQNKLLVAAMHCIDAVGSYARDGGFSTEHKRCVPALRTSLCRCPSYGNNDIRAS